MAKQKKQKKAGLAKRKLQKKQKKTAVKRKEMGQKRPAPKQMSMSKVRKNLKNLPLLIFESELREMTFTAEEIKAVEADNERAPDQIAALATSEYQEKLKIKLVAMKGRSEKESDVNKMMMVNAMLYFMEQEMAPAFMNQIIVGLYLETKIKMDTPDAEVTLDLLNQKIKDYDKTWEPYLEEKLDEIREKAESMGQEGVRPVDVEDGGDTDFADVDASPFESLISDYAAYATEKMNLDEDQVDRSQEDLEALLNDYCEEKEITDVENLTQRKVKNFVEGWFIRNMNPTKEDVEGMLLSLSGFYTFAKDTGVVPSETAETIAVYLANKDDILAKLEN